MDNICEELHELIEKCSNVNLSFGDIEFLSGHVFDASLLSNNENYKNIGWGCHGHPYQHSDETKKLLSEIKTGTTRSKSSKEKQSKAISGINNHFYGKKHTLKSKKVMSAKAKIRSSDGSNNNAKPVIYNSESFSCKKLLTKKYGMSLYIINKMIKSGEIVYG